MGVIRCLARVAGVVLIVAVIMCVLAIILPNFRSFGPRMFPFGPGAISSPWGGLGLQNNPELYYMFQSPMIWIIPICALLVLMFFSRIFLTSVNRYEKRRTLTNEESDTLQEIWDGLVKMEDRVMNIETILVHHTRREPF